LEEEREIGGGEFCCLATVIELASRRPGGWAIADHMRAQLVIKGPASGKFDAQSTSDVRRGVPVGCGSR
jgi:hypothetical protein